jgi:hypothetical protein
LARVWLWGANAAPDSRADVVAEHKKHDEVPTIVLDWINELQYANDEPAPVIVNLNAKIKEQLEKSSQAS